MKVLESVQTPHTFNPYSQRCLTYDVPNAPQLRSTALLHVLNASLDMEIESMWLGRDLGYRGGRRTGLALTDDVHFHMHLKRWHLAFAHPTKDRSLPERTAAIVWRVLSRLEMPIFLWNIFPLHPYEPGNHFSNRRHNSTERGIGEDLLAELILMIRPRHLVAIGNDASRSARRLASPHNVFQVRHPSYGGQRDFIGGIQELYASRDPTAG